MARKPREIVEGGIYHAYARGNGATLIYLDDEDRGHYLRRLGQVTDTVGWRCLSYCLMGTHVHLLLETPRANLDNGMQRLHGGYAQEFNKRHGRRGHLFEGRYGAVRAESTEQVWTTAAYIARNPVEAGLCELPAQWPWSSHRATLAGFGPRWLDTARLLWHFGGDRGARRRYAELVQPSAAGHTPVTGV